MDDVTLQNLPAQDQVTFLIGRAARLNVSIEHWARLAWQVLVGGSPAQYAIPRGPRDTLDSITKICPHIGLEHEEVEGSLRAVKAIEAAYNQRHMVVHSNWSYGVDGWTPLPIDYRDILNGKMKPTWTLEDFKALQKTLMDAGRKAAALCMLFSSVISTPMELVFPEEADTKGQLRPYWLPVLTGIEPDPSILDSLNERVLMVMDRNTLPSVGR